MNRNDVALKHALEEAIIWIVKWIKATDFSTVPAIERTKDYVLFSNPDLQRSIVFKAKYGVYLIHFIVGDRGNPTEYFHKEIPYGGPALHVAEAMVKFLREPLTKQQFNEWYNAVASLED